ncbi:MAG: hypothetical protein ACM30G_06025, partial [Micromonosporaceae bacterium]
MHVRPAAQPDEPEPRRVPGDVPRGHVPSGGVPAGVEQVSYQVSVRVILAKVALVLLLALVAWTAPNHTQTQVGLLVAAAATVVVARDVIARQRLRADRSEVVVRRGYAGWRRL